MSWLSKLLPSKIRTDLASRKKSVPEGLWSTCSACQAILYQAELQRNLSVCPRCDHHMRLTGRERIETFLDAGEQVEIGADIKPADMLKFKDSKKYKDRLTAAQKKTGENDALVAMAGQLEGSPVVVTAFDFSFIGGSMGAVVGERFALAAEYALKHRQPFICFSTSGGARMQESVVSLLQMAKTSAALTKLADAHIPYISIMTDPTYGGVSASLALLGDVNIAEPGAMIGFTGPRVIEQTVREVLPEGFQKSDFLLEHGFLDMIIDRRELRSRVARLLGNLRHYVN